MLSILRARMRPKNEQKTCQKQKKLQIARFAFARWLQKHPEWALGVLRAWRKNAARPYRSLQGRFCPCAKQQRSVGHDILGISGNAIRAKAHTRLKLFLSVR